MEFSAGLRGDFTTIHAIQADVQRLVTPLGGRAVLAGGAIRDFYFGLKPKDYDIFILFPHPLKPPALKALRDTIACAFLPKQNTLISDKLVDQLGDPEFAKGYELVIKLMDSDDEVTALQYGGKPLQFIYAREHQGGQGLVDSFDLDMCQFGYDGEGFYVGKGVDLQEVRNALFYKGPITLMNPKSSYARLKRFQSRYQCDVLPAAKQLFKYREGSESKKEAGFKELWFMSAQGGDGAEAEGDSAWIYYKEGYPQLRTLEDVETFFKQSEE